MVSDSRLPTYVVKPRSEPDIVLSLRLNVALLGQKDVVVAGVFFIAKMVLVMASFRPFSRIRRPSGRRRTAAAAWKGSGWYSSAVVRELKLDGFGPNLIKNGFHVQGRRHPFRPIAVGSIDDDSGVGAVDIPGSMRVQSTQKWSISGRFGPRPATEWAKAD